MKYRIVEDGTSYKLEVQTDPRTPFSTYIEKYHLHPTEEILAALQQGYLWGCIETSLAHGDKPVEGNILCSGDFLNE